MTAAFAHHQTTIPFELYRQDKQQARLALMQYTHELMSLNGKWDERAEKLDQAILKIEQILLETEHPDSYYNFCHDLYLRLHYGNKY